MCVGKREGMNIREDSKRVQGRSIKKNSDPSRSDEDKNWLEEGV